VCIASLMSTMLPASSTKEKLADLLTVPMWERLRWNLTSWSKCTIFQSAKVLFRHLSHYKKNGAAQSHLRTQK
jgi:hypothetical protein